MRADCIRVRVPEHARPTGFTAAGERVSVVAGEHVVQRLKPKVPLEGIVETLRFLGADAAGRDVHVPVSSQAELDTILCNGQERPH